MNILILILIFMLPQPVGVLKLMLKLFCVVHIHG